MQVMQFCTIGIVLGVLGCTPLQLANVNLVSGKHQTLESQLALAMLSEKHSDTNRAEELYRNLIVRDPKNVESRRRLAIIASRKGNLDEAARLFDECVVLEPRNADLLNDFGYACYIGGQLEEAEKNLKSAVQLDPNAQSAWTNLGLVYAQQGRFQECREAFSNGTESTADLHCNMAYVYAQSMKLEQARNEFIKAIDLDPNCAAAAHGLLQVCTQIPGNEPKTVLSTFAISNPSNKTELEELQNEDHDSFELQPPNSGTVSLNISSKKNMDSSSSN